MSIRFPTQVEIVCNDDRVHCGDCDERRVLWECFRYKVKLKCDDNPQFGFLRCQACLDKQVEWENRLKEAKFDLQTGSKNWEVRETRGGDTVAYCRNHETAKAIAALPKLVKAIKTAIQHGENEYVLTELEDALATLEPEVK